METGIRAAEEVKNYLQRRLNSCHSVTRPLSESGLEIQILDESPGYFEGPEKTLEVVFRDDRGSHNGLRSLSRSQLDDLCNKAKCTILSQLSNAHMDAYVLSESSLFIFENRLIMKTCGTTTPLVSAYLF